jgi:TonB family protein
MLIALALALSGQINSFAPPKADVWAWDPKVPICSLKQQPYPDGETVEIERTPANDETVLEVTLPPKTKLRNGHFLDATVAIDSGGRFAADVLVGVDKAGRTQLYMVSPDPAFIGQLAGTATLEVVHAKIGSIRVPIHIAPTIITTLRECEDKTMTEWGIDPAAWRSLQARPFPLNHVRDGFSALDYPAEASRAHVEADAIIRLDIAADGRVSACRALNPGLLRGFETASCDVLKGAKFRPAVDSAGRPVSAPIVYDVRFRLGD